MSEDPKFFFLFYSNHMLYGMSYHPDICHLYPQYPLCQIYFILMLRRNKAAYIIYSFPWKFRTPVMISIASNPLNSSANTCRTITLNRNMGASPTQPTCSQPAIAHWYKYSWVTVEVPGLAESSSVTFGTVQVSLPVLRDISAHVSRLLLVPHRRMPPAWHSIFQP